MFTSDLVHFPFAHGARTVITPPPHPVMAAPTPALVSVQWLANAVRENRVGPKLRVLDASWFLPMMHRDPKAEFALQHIPGASFFDIEECRDQSSEFDHMLPAPGDFSAYVGALGIGGDAHVVVYDTSDFGSFIAPRVWWMFRLFGHHAVSILDGGMRSWLAEGFPVTAELSRPERAEFQATLNQAWVKSYEDVLENIGTRQAQVVDVRTEGRFRGVEPEPRAGGLNQQQQLAPLPWRRFPWQQSWMIPEVKHLLMKA